MKGVKEKTTVWVVFKRICYYKAVPDKRQN